MRRRILLCMAVLVLSGCGGRELLNKQTTPAPVTSGPQAPSLVDLQIPVSKEEYQQALAAIGASLPTRQNAEHYFTIAQYQYNQAFLSDAIKTYKQLLMATGSMPQLDKAQYMAGQVYYSKRITFRPWPPSRISWKSTLIPPTWPKAGK